MLSGKINVYSYYLRKHVYKQRNICSGKTCLLLASVANLLIFNPIKMWQEASFTNFTSHIILTELFHRKETHGLGEQTYGCQEGGEGAG